MISEETAKARREFDMFAIELLESGCIGQMTAFEWTRAGKLTAKQKEAVYQQMIRLLWTRIQELATEVDALANKLDGLDASSTQV